MMVMGRFLKFSCFTLVGVALAAGSAGLAYGELSQYSGLTQKHIVVFDDMSTIDVEPDGGASGSAATYYDSFSNAPGGAGFLAAGPATGIIGTDDYASAGLPIGVDLIQLTEFQFAGGVQDAGGIAFFDFLDTGSNFVDGFGVQFPAAGNFLWTISISSTDILVPGDGFIEINVDADSNPSGGGQFFLSDNVPAVGTTQDTPPGALGPGDEVLNHTFAITGIPVPEPSSMLLLALAGLGLFAVRRR